MEKERKRINYSSLQDVTVAEFGSEMSVGRSSGFSFSHSLALHSPASGPVWKRCRFFHADCPLSMLVLDLVLYPVKYDYILVIHTPSTCLL